MGVSIDHEFPRTSPEQQGISSAALLQWIEAMERECHEIHSFMLLRHGCVVAEAWWSPYASEHQHLVFSLSKSVTATAVGLAIAEGYFSIDDCVVSFFPDDVPAPLPEFLKALCVRDLLIMATGHASDPWPAMLERHDGNWIKGFLQSPLVEAPGTNFVYNTGATYMLSAIIQQTTKLNLRDYLEPRLFAPLGIKQVSWQASPQGITVGGIGLSLTTEAIARFGQLYLQRGLWNGQQLLPEAWVEQATALQIVNGNDPDSDWMQGYGYQFWRCRHGAYRGDGVFGQYCVIMPDQAAVLVITGGMDVFAMQQPLNLFWELILPAMGEAGLAEPNEAYRQLNATLTSRQFQPVQGQATSASLRMGVEYSYQVDPNPLAITAIRLHFTEAGARVIAQTPAGQETICCGYAEWESGQTGLFKQQFFDSTPFVASGAWTTDNSFTMVVRLYETPFFYTMNYHFVGDELLIEIQINVSLEALTPHMLTAKRLC